MALPSILHTLSILLVLWASQAAGEHPGSIFLAYLLNYSYRVLVLGGLVQVARAGKFGSGLLSLLTSPPGPSDRNQPLRQGDQAGPPASLWVYLLLILFLGYMGFILIHAEDTRNLDVDLRQGMDELAGASWLALIWLVQDLAGRRLVADPKMDLTYNLGFNAEETGVLAMAILTGGLLTVAGEIFGLGRSPWWTVGLGGHPGPAPSGRSPRPESLKGTTMPTCLGCGKELTEESRKIIKGEMAGGGAPNYKVVYRCANGSCEEKGAKKSFLDDGMMFIPLPDGQ
jgi:hypothetical protein